MYGIIISPCQRRHPQKGEVHVINFEDLKKRDLEEILSNKKELSLRIPDQITEFSTEIPNVDFSKEKEVPPTSVIFTRKGLAEVVMPSSPDLKGKYIRFIFLYMRLGVRSSLRILVMDIMKQRWCGLIKHLESIRFRFLRKKAKFLLTIRISLSVMLFFRFFPRMLSTGME
jgi:hypothetical protein